MPRLDECGVAALAESPRRELIAQLREDVRAAAERHVGSIEPLEPDDVAYIVTCPRRVAVNKTLIRAAVRIW